MIFNASSPHTHLWDGNHSRELNFIIKLSLEYPFLAELNLHILSLAENSLVSRLEFPPLGCKVLEYADLWTMNPLINPRPLA